MSEGSQNPQQKAQDTGEQAEEQGNEDSYSYSDSSTETHTEDKTPKGPLATLLNLDILPSPESNTTTMESSDSDDYYGPAYGPQEGEAQETTTSTEEE